MRITPYTLATFPSTVATTASTGTVYSATDKYLLAPERQGVIGSVFTHVDRGNRYSTWYWTSSGPWTTFSAYGSYADNSLIQFVNMATGDGMGSVGTTQASWMGEAAWEGSRVVQWAHGNRCGHDRDVFYFDNNLSYSGHTLRILPIRNTSSSPISVSLSAYVSSYFSSGYDGASLFVLYPTGSLYSTAGNINSTLIKSDTTSSNSVLVSGSYSVPGGTTVLVCLTSTDWYVTTYRFRDVNYFSNLSTTFSDPNIICDMRMLTSLSMSRFNLSYAASAVNTTALTPLWTTTGSIFGDR